MNFQHRLHRVIPGGAHTYSRSDDSFPAVAPPILKNAFGAYVYDPDNNEYLDYGMGLRSITLGYADKRVNEAAIAQINNGNNLTRASLIELEAAELICSLFPSADMVKFAKNGSNVTSAALKVARSYTGKKYVAIPRQQPFFSFDDWFIYSTAVKRGIPEDHGKYTLIFDFNDIKSLELLFNQYDGQIAAVMLEPSTHLVPCGLDLLNLQDQSSYINASQNRQTFLHKVQSLCRQYNALFILDEMITGFRFSINGAQSIFNVQPDLSCFGKAMANGFSLAALVGKKEIMSVGSIDQPNMERTFLLSSTHGAEMGSLGAFVKTCEIYKSNNVCDYLWGYGSSLSKSLKSIISTYNLDNYFKIEGPPILLSYKTLDQDMITNNSFRALFSQEMIKKKVLMPWISWSTCHREIELERTLEAFDSALSIYCKAIDQGSVLNLLEGDPIKNIFRPRN